MATRASQPRIGTRERLERSREGYEGGMIEPGPAGNPAHASTKPEGRSMPMSLPALLLRLEGAVLLGGATLLYREQGASWLLFALLLFAPDLLMLGYLGGRRIGAMAYNIGHTTVLAVALAVAGVVIDQSGMVAVGLIWLAHIGLDRMIGYGLKYPNGFKETHLARV